MHRPRLLAVDGRESVAKRSRPDLPGEDGRHGAGAEDGYKGVALLLSLLPKLPQPPPSLPPPPDDKELLSGDKAAIMAGKAVAVGADEEGNGEAVKHRHLGCAGGVHRGRGKW